MKQGDVLAAYIVAQSCINLYNIYQQTRSYKGEGGGQQILNFCVLTIWTSPIGNMTMRHMTCKSYVRTYRLLRCSHRLLWLLHATFLWRLGKIHTICQRHFPGITHSALPPASSKEKPGLGRRSQPARGCCSSFTCGAASASRSTCTLS